MEKSSKLREYSNSILDWVIFWVLAEGGLHYDTVHEMFFNWWTVTWLFTKLYNHGPSLTLYYMTFKTKKNARRWRHLGAPFVSLKSFDKNSADKIQSKKYQEIKSPMAV